MAHIKEPLDIDFFVEPKPLTEIERKMISAFIQDAKNKQKGKKKRKGTPKKKEIEVIG